MYHQKLLCFFLSSFIFLQTTINIMIVSHQLYENQITSHPYLKFQSSINSQEKSGFFLNDKNNDRPSSWFYHMDPYNDTWGSDILKVYNIEGTRPIKHYPFDNSVLSFQSKYQNRQLNKNASVYLSILGFNLKKLNISGAKNYFYGSE